MLTVSNYEIMENHTGIYLIKMRGKTEIDFKTWVSESTLFYYFSQRHTERYQSLYQPFTIIQRRNRVSSAFHAISINCKKFQDRRP